MLAPIILALSLLLGGYAPYDSSSSGAPAAGTVTPYDGGSGGPPLLP